MLFRSLGKSVDGQRISPSTTQKDVLVATSTSTICSRPRASGKSTCSILMSRMLCCDKNNKASLIKKKHKNKRELKTETRNDPTTTHIYTQTNIYKHWSQRPIRRGVPIGDNRQAPDQRRYNREESQRRTHIHAQTQDHTEQTAECCHRRITTNRHTIYLEMSNRIHPVQGGFHPSLHSIPILFSFISESC